MNRLAIRTAAAIVAGILSISLAACGDDDTIEQEVDSEVDEEREEVDEEIQEEKEQILDG